MNWVEIKGTMYNLSNATSISKCNTKDKRTYGIIIAYPSFAMSCADSDQLYDIINFDSKEERDDVFKKIINHVGCETIHVERI